MCARAEEEEKYWLKPDQVEQLRDAARSGRHPDRDDALLALLYDTGLRRGEAASVDIAMLDLKEAELRIPSSIQKDYPNDSTPPPATFALDSDASLGTVSALQTYLKTRDGATQALFESQKGGRLSGKAINDAVKKAARDADVRPYCYAGRGEPADVTSHTLRHSVPWRMLRSAEGNTLYDVRNRLRHASLLTTEREYDHFVRI